MVRRYFRSWATALHDTIICFLSLSIFICIHICLHINWLCQYHSEKLEQFCIPHRVSRLPPKRVYFNTYGAMRFRVANLCGCAWAYCICVHTWLPSIQCSWQCARTRFLAWCGPIPRANLTILPGQTVWFQSNRLRSSPCNVFQLDLHSTHCNVCHQKLIRILNYMQLQCVTPSVQLLCGWRFCEAFGLRPHLVG